MGGKVVTPLWRRAPSGKRPPYIRYGEMDGHSGLLGRQVFQQRAVARARKVEQGVRRGKAKVPVLRLIRRDGRHRVERCIERFDAAPLAARNQRFDRLDAHVPIDTAVLRELPERRLNRIGFVAKQRRPVAGKPVLEILILSLFDATHEGDKQ